MRPVLVTGAAGQLGRAFLHACDVRGLSCVGLTRSELDIADPDATLRVLDRHEPWLVVNAAGYTRVDRAEDDHEKCFRDNVVGPLMLARAAAARGLPLVTFSSELVFDGRTDSPYDEQHAPAPLGAYGRSKLEGERRVLDAHPRTLVVRTSALFTNFVTTTLRALARGETVRTPADVVVSPTSIGDVVTACLDLAIDGESGLWHLANPGITTWTDFARSIAVYAGHDPEAVVAIAGPAFGWRAPRPAYGALGSTRGSLLPPLAHALQQHLSQREVEQE